MLIKFNKNLVGSILFLLISITLWLMIPYQIVLKHDREINSQTFPRLVIGLMGVISLVMVIKEIIAIVKHMERAYLVINIKEEYKSWIMLGNIILYWVMLFWIPFLYASLIFASAVLVMYQCKKWTYYVITFSFIITVTLLFEHVLNVNLP